MRAYGGKARATVNRGIKSVGQTPRGRAGQKHGFGDCNFHPMSFADNLRIMSDVSRYKP